MKSVRIWSYSGLYFPVFGLNTKRYSASFRIHSECRKKRTRITPNTNTFYAVAVSHVSFMSKREFERLQFWLQMLFQENCLFRGKTGIFLKLESLLKTQRAKEKFSDNRRNNIMKQFKILVYVWFSKAGLYFFLNKLCIGVPTRVSKQLQT